MATNQLKKFNVILYNFNGRKFVPYDVLPYFRNTYQERVKRHKELVKRSKRSKNFDESVLNDKYNKVPVTFEEFKTFVKGEAMYQFWSRCEYEIILSDWPPSKPPVEEKWDVYDQIMMNLDIVAEILFKEYNKDENRSNK